MKINGPKWGDFGHGAGGLMQIPRNKTSLGILRLFENLVKPLQKQGFGQGRGGKKKNKSYGLAKTLKIIEICPLF